MKKLNARNIRNPYYALIIDGDATKYTDLSADQVEKMDLVYNREIHRYVSEDNRLIGAKSLARMLERDGVVLNPKKKYVIEYAYDCFRYGTASGSNYWYGFVYEVKQ